MRDRKLNKGQTNFTFYRGDLYYKDNWLHFWSELNSHSSTKLRSCLCEVYYPCIQPHTCTALSYSPWYSTQCTVPHLYSPQDSSSYPTQCNPIIELSYPPSGHLLVGNQLQKIFGLGKNLWNITELAVNLKNHQVERLSSKSTTNIPLFLSIKTLSILSLIKQLRRPAASCYRHLHHIVHTVISSPPSTSVHRAQWGYPLTRAARCPSQTRHYQPSSQQFGAGI
jgi:hypothetical protein